MGTTLIRRHVFGQSLDCSSSEFHRSPGPLRPGRSRSPVAVIVRLSASVVMLLLVLTSFWSPAVARAAGGSDRLVRDGFNRTRAVGWGASDSGQRYSYPAGHDGL